MPNKPFDKYRGAKWQKSNVLEKRYDLMMKDFL